MNGAVMNRAVMNGAVMNCVTLKALILRGRPVSWLAALAILALAPICGFGQQNPAEDDQQPPRHVLWIIPNFRTSPEMKEYKPVTPKEKFRIAKQDTFDRGTFALAAAFAGEGLLERSQPSYGEGVEGYAHYWATSYANFAIGNYMTEGIFPVLLHQDPRYFRRGSGSGWTRLGSAVGQIFWTHTDSGGRQFNYSEVAGNSAAVAISMAYSPASRSASDAVESLGTQIAVDMAANIVKEFWPNRLGKNSRAHRAQ